MRSPRYIIFIMLRVEVEEVNFISLYPMQTKFRVYRNQFVRL